MISILKKMVLPIVFFIPIGMFFFDFITIELNENRTLISGFELLKNTSAGYNIWLVLALTCGFLGFTISWLKGKIKYVIGFLLALAGIIFLVVSQFSIIETFNGKGKELVAIAFEPAYWLCLLAFAIAGSRCYLLQYRASQKREIVETKGVVNINIITQSNKVNEK